MKLKTSAIAMAVAGTLAAPVVVQAGADEIYASARIGLWNQDTGGVSEMDVRSFSSRFGARGETDLGNGLTGFGRYEWDVDLGEGGGLGVRHRYVGLKGDFGQALIGQTNHTFYNHVVGPLDIPWWHSGYNMIAYGAPNQTSSRGDNAITYSGSSGAVTFGVTTYFDLDVTRGSTDPNASEDLDGYELGITVGLGDLSVGLAVQDIEVTDEATTGIIVHGIALGDATVGISFMNQDKDDGIVIDAGFGNFIVHLEQTMRDASDTDPLAITLGYTQSLGRKTTMWYEFFQLDADTSDSDDDVTRVMAVLKYDII